MKKMAAFTLDDPRINARKAPYTYFLPPQDRLDAVGPGDLVKLVFRPTASGTKWEVERMWVAVTAVHDDALHGVLDNDPNDIPGLSAGEPVTFQRWHIVSVLFQDPANDERHPPQKTREFWERCMVDQCVLDGEKQIELIYREEPDLAGPNDKDPDSGWRIRGDFRTCTDEEIDARKAAYVAIGAVLNRDDSWLHLIDEPIGARYRRDFETGEYFATDA